MNDDEQMRMTPERYAELLAGPLTHRVCALRISRLQQALFYVARVNGWKGAHALEDWCKERAEQDEIERAEREYRPVAQ